MRPRVKPLAIAGVATAAALSVSGLSPTMAAETDGTDGPAIEATAAPVETPTPTPTASETDPPAEEGPSDDVPAVTEEPAPTEEESDDPEGSDEPAETEATGLLDLTVLDATFPIALPGLTVPLFKLGWLGLIPQPVPATADPQFGGNASALYAEALASDAIQVRTGQLGAIAMKPDGTPTDHTTAHVEVPYTVVPPPLPPIPIAGLTADGVRVRTAGGLTVPDQRPSATARTEIETVSGNIYAANITADGVHVSANVQRLADGQYKFTGKTKFAYLSIYGMVNWEDKEIEPNRTYDVAGLGKVVLNEQVLTQIPGDRQGIRVTAIHITLGTSKHGLPAGTDIYIGSAEAVIYDR